jgi:hypothetical protein
MPAVSLFRRDDIRMSAMDSGSRGSPAIADVLT